MVERGRDPALRLEQNGRQRSVADWGHEIFAELAQAAELLDTLEEGSPHAEAVAAFTPWLDDPALTPSGRLLARLEASGEEFIEATLALAEEQAQAFREQAMQPAREENLNQLVETSHRQQRDIEAAESESFDDFLEAYFANAREPRVAKAQPGERQ